MHRTRLGDPITPKNTGDAYKTNESFIHNDALFRAKYKYHLDSQTKDIGCDPDYFTDVVDTETKNQDPVSLFNTFTSRYLGTQSNTSAELLPYAVFFGCIAAIWVWNF